MQSLYDKKLYILILLPTVLLVIGFFVTLLASGTGYTSLSNDEILHLAITSLLGAIPIYFLWFRKT